MKARKEKKVDDIHIHTNLFNLSGVAPPNLTETTISQIFIKSLHR